MENHQTQKIYFVDSENIGDLWVQLLAAADTADQLLIFYTQKSPHMNYESLRMLLEQDKKAIFIKCYEGQNALDFQLVTELGHHLALHPEAEHIIVTNDNGFEPVVKYWTDREQRVSRLNAKDLSKKPKVSPVKKACEGTDSEPEKAAEKTTPEREPQQNREASPSEEETLVREILCCIGRDNMADLHNVLVMLLGEDAGKELYLRARSRSEYLPTQEEAQRLTSKEKFTKYCHAVFSHSELANEASENVAAFLYSAKDKRKNLNSLRAALQGQYGKDKGMKYYSLLKSHIKLINRM